MSSEKLNVIYPESKEPVWKIAADEFASYWKKVTGRKPSVRKAGKRLPDGQLVLIGNDSVNPFVRDMLVAGKIERFNIKYGSDEYEIRSMRVGRRDILLVAGGCGRSTLYAVYDFFRKQAGAEYFWDGEVIPENTRLKISGVNIVEQPQLEYRGLRYFAHRGLHRFQAEHWGFEDWKREIDWMVKKRFSFFMLRTGIDDIFQRAFGLPYPPQDGPDPDRVERSFDDRTSFWPLKYRGELRKKVMRYALDRGLLHPADAGTITHWYSHTPSSFYKKHKNFPVLKQAGGAYQGRDAAKIWDIFDQRSWDAYWKLTETMISEWGEEQSRMFHTIGLAERTFGKDRKENFRIKLYALRKIQQEIRERYPDTPLMLAGWDFWLCWDSEEVRELMKELDPEKTIVFDYTADDCERVPYEEWGLQKRFPWIFGIFQGYARDSEICNDYRIISKRLKKVRNDPMCKGLAMWPEISHTDTFMLEYLAENSWSLDDPSLEHAVERFVGGRYPAAIAKKMRNIWSEALAVTQMVHWDYGGMDYYRLIHPKSHFRILSKTFTALTKEKVDGLKGEVKRALPVLKGSALPIRLLANLVGENARNELWRRDALDITRSILEYAYSITIKRHCIARENWRLRKGKAEELALHADNARAILDALENVLAASDDFSLYASFKRLSKTAPVNPHTEHTLKSNIENGYCRTQVYELIDALYRKELEAYLNWSQTKVDSDKRSAWVLTDDLERSRLEIQDGFYKTPLEAMKPQKRYKSGADFAKMLNDVSKLMKSIFV